MKQTRRGFLATLAAFFAAPAVALKAVVEAVPYTFDPVHLSEVPEQDWKGGSGEVMLIGTAGTEVNYSGYTRQKVFRTEAGWHAIPDDTLNSATITFEDLVDD